ncbi:MAG: 6,7-dimethyl-8-ribityllumazine synthase [Acidobacteria bacterium]|nr:6,7-dimethyl-8-ribityllumazine synthase [Acidobacteriota bacterium]
MARERKGELSARGLRLGIVVSRFNQFITDRLLNGALDALKRAGANSKQIDVVRVPGSFEIPVTAQQLAASGRYDAVICLGAILRGETSHFEYICAEVTRGIQRAALDTGVPIALGVITVDTLEQAIDRAGAKSGNKGAEAALTAVEMANLLRRLPRRSKGQAMSRPLP